MATNAVRRGLRAAVSSVAACRTTTAAVNVFPARSATDGFGASYHSASAWRSRAACGATTAAFGGKNASSSLLGGGAMGAALVEGVAAVGVAGQVAPGATALPFALRMLVGSNLRAPHRKSPSPRETAFNTSPLLHRQFPRRRRNKACEE